jgi:hypothetical protein
VYVVDAMLMPVFNPVKTGAGSGTSQRHGLRHLLWSLRHTAQSEGWSAGYAVKLREDRQQGAGESRQPVRPGQGFSSRVEVIANGLVGRGAFCRESAPGCARGQVQPCELRVEPGSPSSMAAIGMLASVTSSDRSDCTVCRIIGKGCGNVR